MLSLSLPGRVFLCTLPTDMRKSFDSLSGLVKQQLGQDALSGDLSSFAASAATASSSSIGTKMAWPSGTSGSKKEPLRCRPSRISVRGRVTMAWCCDRRSWLCCSTASTWPASNVSGAINGRHPAPVWPPAVRHPAPRLGRPLKYIGDIGMSPGEKRSLLFRFFRERIDVRARLTRHEHGRSCCHL